MYHEYALVQAQRDISPMVPKGTCGTVVMVHDGIIGDYEVEFVDEEGNLKALLTVNKADLKLLHE